MAEQRRCDVIAEMERLLQVRPPERHDEPDIEALFTLLDLSLMMPGEVELAHLDWRQMRPKVIGMITEAFMGFQDDLERLMWDNRVRRSVRGLDRGPLLATCGSWANRVGPGDTLISFNWDLLHETVLFRRGMWLPSDGYGFRPKNLEEHVESSPVQLLKLHGSVNWAHGSEDDEDIRILHAEHFFPAASKYRSDDHDSYMKEAGTWDLGRKSLVIPTYLKSVATNRTTLAVWRRAAEALSVATDVVVIGYRLHTADTLATYLIASSLASNPGSPAVTIVSPAARGQDNWNALGSSVGIGINRVRQRFEEWVG